MPRLASALPLALILSGGLVLSGGAAVAATDDGQVIDPGQQQGTGRVVLEAGHADVGATFGTGAWALQVHDDTTTPRYWRDPDDVVLRVTDAAVLTVPDDEAFAFLRLAAGTPVHVIPQTEQAGVVWVGWNTQEPTLLDSLSLGATLRIHAIEGPGDVVTYLQGGNFGAPQVLWSTHEPFPQEAWVELNTHTHANWVFSEPGVYLVDAEFAGDLVTGEELSARGTLRFAVGDATDPAAAFAATLSRGDGTGSPGGAGAGTDAGDSGGGTDAGGGTGTEDGTTGDGDAGGAAIGAWPFVAGGAVVLAVAVVAVSTASARARRRARTTGGAA
ncbi:choice-of-anchor M domain-containing protein [Microbacterium sp. No. 7]|uniref:choice-of-anchor M domain-containing protein n=1 Tax=Microbacterium sp. No. 7 TaxID=1714373 RepID=UPI0006D2A4ED|nr:choice-of-anchor M domain-containing protein [Microbacterium sp. No. 7]ALJ18696.1 hypothetical protein AOA12_01705 [Microbacterium sp. No. 7]